MNLELIGGFDPEAFARGEVHNPHSVLGAHVANVGGEAGVVVRAYHPDATGCELLREGEAPCWMTRFEGGLFAGFVPRAHVPLVYRLRFHFETGADWERDDPYRFLPTLGDVDLHLIGEG